MKTIVAIIATILLFSTQAQARHYKNSGHHYVAQSEIRHTQNTQPWANNLRYINERRQGLGAGLIHMLRKSREHRVEHHIDHSDGGLTTVDTAAHIKVTIAASIATKFQDLIADLVEHGFMPKEIGCYARGGHIRGSMHYKGLACDIDQDARNVTRKYLYSKEANELIHLHGFDNGCSFHDCGHVSYGEIGRYAHYAHHQAKVRYVHRARHIRYAHTG